MNECQLQQIRQTLHNSRDMLEGNIKRMIVTTNRKEMYKMYLWALKHLRTMNNLCLEKRILMDQNNKGL